MAIFKKKKPGYVDLGKKLARQEEKIESFKSSSFSNESVQSEPEPEQQSSGFFGGFFGGSSTAADVQTSPSADEKRERLKKRIMDMTNRIEEQEKEIYQLKQRMEVLERKQRLSY